MVDLPSGTSLRNQFCRNITILQDRAPESRENFTVLLGSASPFVVVNPIMSTATVNILGDSKLKITTHHNPCIFNTVIIFTLLFSLAIIFQLSQTNYNVSEGGGFAEVCIDLISGVLSANTPIEITPQTGTAGGSLFHFIHNQYQIPCLCSS